MESGDHLNEYNVFQKTRFLFFKFQRDEHHVDVYEPMIWKERINSQWISRMANSTYLIFSGSELFSAMPAWCRTARGKCSSYAHPSSWSPCLSAVGWELAWSAVPAGCATGFRIIGNKWRISPVAGHKCSIFNFINMQSSYQLTCFAPLLNSFSSKLASHVALSILKSILFNSHDNGLCI